ncbi:uncharacterized protein LOC119720826 [Patiria miniata]|uniref:Uncharacterized protein n=1 Tax=Patiria miniata TaxID=46514 RepID=A0A913Z706_PATMI|nr:uncharacterized protein LOC119720826 [Patiria miniata]
MEILRKRTHIHCECQNNVGSGVMHKRMPAPEHMQFHDVGLMSMMSAPDDNIFGRQQKRKCNGVSSYIPQADHAKERIGMLDTCLPPSGLAASVGNETVAMVTDSDAASYHSHNIPAQSMHHARHIMTSAGDATNSSVSLQAQNQARKVCQRCLSGEPGHITHIVS